MKTVMIDSFSGPVTDLKPDHRTERHVLAALHKRPRVSTFDMSELGWLRTILADLKRKGWIDEKDEPYPWHYYALTDAGRAELGMKA